MIRFLEEATDEFSDAVRYYNSERPGLGYELAVEVKNSLERIKKYPESWTEIIPGIRKCIVNRFPYAVLYHKKSEVILIIAIMHLKRKPRNWKVRLEGIEKK